MKRMLLLCHLFLLANFAMGQTYVGMNLSRYYNWGQEMSWVQARDQFPKLSYLDSAANAGTQYNSEHVTSIVWVGGQIRVQPTDTNKVLWKWTRNYYLNLGGIRAEKFEAVETFYKDSNLPYTTIYNGDTSNYLLDSISRFTHSMQTYGGFGQIGYGLSRKLVGEYRVEGEFGMRCMAGYGTIYGDYKQLRENELVDTTNGSGSVHYSATSYEAPVPKSNLWMFSFDIIGGVYIPLEQGKSNWWLGLHGIIGVSSMYNWGTWKSRVNGSPQFSLHYRIPTKEEREKMKVSE